MADSTASYTTVSNEDFAEKVLQAPQMAVVNFSSARSSSCQIFEPEFAAIGQVDVDSNEELINQYTVEGIPTLIFFKNGQEINRIKGIVMRDRLRRQIEGALLVGSYPKSGDASYDNPSAG